MEDDTPVGNMSKQALWVQVGRELTRNEDHALPLDPRELRDRAKAWFSANKEELEKRICSNVVRELVDTSDAPTLVAAIADLISACCIGVSPITVAWLITRQGLHAFCARQWDGGGKD